MRKKDRKAREEYKKVMASLTIEDIEKGLDEYIQEIGYDPFVKHYEWEEVDENGIMRKYSSWKIGTGKAVIHCGDGGMRMFEEAMLKQGFKSLEIIKDTEDIKDIKNIKEL